MKNITSKMLFAFVALLTTLSTSFAQLSGTYTVNAGATTSGTNFQSFTDLGNPNCVISN